MQNKLDVLRVQTSKYGKWAYQPPINCQYYVVVWIVFLTFPVNDTLIIVLHKLLNERWFSVAFLHRSATFGVHITNKHY